jgi:hypothetical protein
LRRFDQKKKTYSKTGETRHTVAKKPLKQLKRGRVGQIQ